MTTKPVNFAISPAKADRLYWLGRYSERVSTALHLLRKYYDEIIDDRHSDAHMQFCSKMGIPCNYSDARTFVHEYLYDANNCFSIINMLEHVKDNAILLREEIKSETLQYIEMSINHMKRCDAEGSGLYELQFITDSMYAFWGALEERILSHEIRSFVKFGKYIEKLDLYIRFGYPVDRVAEIFTRVNIMGHNEKGLCEIADLDVIKEHIEQNNIKAPEMLGLINGLFVA